MLSFFLKALISFQKGGFSVCAYNARGNATKIKIFPNRMNDTGLLLLFENHKIQSPFHRSREKEKEGEHGKQKWIAIFIVKSPISNFETNEKHIDRHKKRRRTSEQSSD